KEYISFFTTSVSAPIDLANSSVSSKIGVRISAKLYTSITPRAVFSNQFHSAESGGRISLVPLMARNLRLSPSGFVASLTSLPHWLTLNPNPKRCHSEEQPRG